MEWQSTFQKLVDLLIETDASRKGWGAYCQGISTGGPWCLEEKRLHINCLELLAIRDPDIYKRQSLRSCQRSSSSLHKQDGRNSLAGSFKSSCTTMGVVPPKQLGDTCSTSTRTFKCQSRPGIQNVTGFQRLETRPLDVSNTSGEMGALGDRSVCIPADAPAPEVC